jgi:hypothetical protein
MRAKTMTAIVLFVGGFVAPATGLAFGADARAARPPRDPHAETQKLDPTNAPFRAKLVSNAALVRRAASTFSTVAKQPAPPKLSGDQRKLYDEHTKWLADGASRLGTLHTQMETVLAKGTKAPATELAQMNMQFLTLREAIEAESRRFNELAAARARHAAAMNAIRAEK